MSGKMEEFSGVLQQRYGYNKAQADKAIDKWLKEADKKLHSQSLNRRPRRRRTIEYLAEPNGSARCRAILSNSLTDWLYWPRG